MDTKSRYLSSNLTFYGLNSYGRSLNLRFLLKKVKVPKWVLVHAKGDENENSIVSTSLIILNNW